MMVQAWYQKIEKDELRKFYLHIFIQLVAKIWLNLSVDHCQFGYIIKLTPPPFPRKIKFKIIIIIIIIIIIKVHKSTHVSGLKIDLYLKFAGLKLELVSGGN